MSEKISWQSADKRLKTGHTASGLPTLQLHLQGSASLLPAVRAHTAMLDEQVRAVILTKVELCDEYQRLAGIRPQWRAADLAQQEATKHLRELQARKADLERTLPVPSGLAGKVAALDEQIRQAEEKAVQAGRELSAISPLYVQASLAIRALVDAEVVSSRDSIIEANAKELAIKQADLLASIGEQLTELFILRRAPEAVRSVDASALAKAIIESPDVEASAE